MTMLEWDSLERFQQPPESQEDKRDRLQRRFDLNLAILRNGMSMTLDRPPTHVALDTVDWLAKLLRAGCPNQETLNMLAAFLEDVSSASGNSKTAWEESTGIANRIFGHSNANGRPTKELNKLRAIGTFRAHQKLVSADEDAGKVEAYNAYFSDAGRTFAVDDEKQVTITKGAKIVHSTKAGRATDNTIGPILRNANLIEKKPAGRRRGKQ